MNWVLSCRGRDLVKGFPKQIQPGASDKVGVQQPNYNTQDSSTNHLQGMSNQLTQTSAEMKQCSLLCNPTHVRSAWYSGLQLWPKQHCHTV
jgi:hypothetical protein